MSYSNSSKIQKITRQEIEKKAKKVLVENDTYSVPIDLIKIANQNGIKVHNAKFSEDNISGMLSKRGDNVTMLINQSDFPNRKRFSIAHELGHHFLHLLEDGEIVDTEIDLFRFEANDANIEDSLKYREIQANQFAAALLMPEELLKEYFNSGITDLKDLADLFKVSQEAMGYRLNQLSLG